MTKQHIALTAMMALFLLSGTVISGSSLENDEVFKGLKSQLESEKDPAIKSRKALRLGVIAYRAQDPSAAGYFDQAIQLKSHLDDYAHFHIGLIEKGLKNLDGAKKHFESVRNHQPVSVLKSDAEFELARVAVAQEKWNEAALLLTRLERARRHDPEYPEILFNLFEVARSRKQRVDACRWALKLYSKFPSFTLPYGWGLEIPYNCPIGAKDREKHFAGLLRAAEYDEVRKEISEFVTAAKNRNSGADENARIEIELGLLSLAEGKISEAIAHFTQSETLGGQSFATQSLLGRAYSQTDNYAAAVEGYMHAYKMSPRSKQGYKALFAAAFSSYQNRDYDGASRRFEELIRKAPKSRLTIDSQWHLAWIRYLKHDYEGAIHEFGGLAQKVRTARRFAKSFDIEKLEYWRAMAEYRQGNVEAARTIFTLLSTTKRLGYYYGAAVARLQTLPAPKPIQTGPALIAPPDRKSEPQLIAPPGSTPSSSPAATVKVDDKNRIPASTEEELAPPEKDAEKTEAEVAADDEDEKDAPEVIGEAPQVTSFKDPTLAARFGRAQELLQLGFDNWARRELREIEKRTSNHEYRQSLMSEYVKVGDFFRSAYIAETYFGVQREKGGVDGATGFWIAAFPQAYNNLVTASCKEFGISASLAWAIMRGESSFREDIHSGAGAMGLMQLIPPTARQVAKTIGFKNFQNNMLLAPDVNIRFGVAYLKRLDKQMKSKLPLIIASYNAGPHRVQGWLKDFGGLEMDEFVEHIPYLETRNYVKKVLRNYMVYQTLYEKKSNTLSWLVSPAPRFDGPKPTAESWID